MNQIHMHEILRRPLNRERALEEDGYRNIFSVTAFQGRTVLLDRGINSVSVAGRAQPPRRPALLITSSPWKAGSQRTPWHDVFDLEHGHVRYFGDHKSTTTKPVGHTPGNRALLDEFMLHSSASRVDRLRACPLVVFRTVTVANRSKGHLEFCGVGLIERVELVAQWDERVRSSFPNYVYDFLVLDLAAEGEALDWDWINARRSGLVDLERSLEYAPMSWRRWVDNGPFVPNRDRRIVSRSRVTRRVDQLPAPGSVEARVLELTYRAFDQDKVAFEKLASDVVARILTGSGARYREGWLTRATADRGIDFVGRLDLGDGGARTSLVVLGQAKCIDPRGPGVSAGQLARVVARLRRGWIGAYVTTGAFTDAAQQELVDDEYPLILVNGLRLAQEVRRLAHEKFGGDTERLFREIREQRPATVMNRRPEEILLL